MEQHLNYSEVDAEAVLIKHQHKVTRQRVGVLLSLMNQKRAFTLRQLSDQLIDNANRITIYRTLKSFLAKKIIGKAINNKGYTCFFYLDHLIENKYTQMYLECSACEQVYGLPALPDQYLNTLNTYEAMPLPMLLSGQCQNSVCNNQAAPTNLNE